MNPSATPPRVWGVIPAAGFGRRMGLAKQALPYGNSTMAGSVVAALLASKVHGVVVVTRPALADQLGLPAGDDRVRVAFNREPDSDMLESIRVGLAALADCGPRESDGVLVVPADMPELSASTCSACAAAYRALPGAIIIATHGGVRGHPIIFPWSLRRAVEHLTGGLRELAARNPQLARLIPCDDAAVTRDLDTPEDYDRLSREERRS